MPHVDDPAILGDVLAITGRAREHSPEVDLVEPAVVHPLEQVWTELQFPVPPFRPVPPTQIRSPSPLAPIADQELRVSRRLPKRSTSARKPGKTTVVEPYSSTIAGP